MRTTPYRTPGGDAVDPRPWWHELAACRGEDPDLFFAADHGQFTNEQLHAARQICHPCKVRQLCIADAVSNADMWSIRGGTTPGQRKLGTCDHCGRTYNPKQDHQRHCSRGCRKAAAAARVRRNRKGDSS